MKQCLFPYRVSRRKLWSHLEFECIPTRRICTSQDNIWRRGRHVASSGRLWGRCMTSWQSPSRSLHGKVPRNKNYSARVVKWGTFCFQRRRDSRLVRLEPGTGWRVRAGDYLERVWCNDSPPADRKARCSSAEGNFRSSSRGTLDLAHSCLFRLFGLPWGCSTRLYRFWSNLTKLYYG